MKFTANDIDLKNAKRFDSFLASFSPVKLNMAVSSFNHEAAKWLSGKLSLLRNHPTNIKDSFKFIDNIKDK